LLKTSFKVFLKVKVEKEAMLSNRFMVPFGAVVVGLAVGTQSAHGQIQAAADGTGTLAPPAVGGVTTIEGGTSIGPAGNNNLFHSFTQFSLPAGETANFVGAAGTTNILSRVTGGSASIINGVLQVSNSNANLYFMNPAGVIFGPGASLNVPASFYATTAAGIGFGGQELTSSDTQTYFNAYGANTYANLTNGPTSLAFPPGFTGSVVNLGNLSVPSGQILGLFSNTIVGGADINSPGSFVAGVSVPTPRLIRFATPGNPLTFEFPTGSFVSNDFPVGIQPTTLPALITGGGFTGVTSVRVDGNNVFLAGAGDAGADLVVNPGYLAVRNINVSSPTLLPSGGAASIRLVGGSNVYGGNLNSSVPAGSAPTFGGTTLIRAGSAGVAGGNPAGGAVRVGAIDAATIDIEGTRDIVSGGNFTTQGFRMPGQPIAIRIISQTGNTALVNLAANNVNAAGERAGGGNIVIQGQGAASTLQMGNADAASIDITTGSTIRTGNILTRGVTTAPVDTIRLINTSGDITTGSLTANNVNLAPAAGTSGGGNIVVTSTGNLTTGIISNNAGVGAAGAAANLPDGGGEVRLISGNGSPRGAGTVTTTDISSASIDIDSGGSFTGGNLFTQGFTMAGRPTAIQIITRSGNANVNSIFANNVNAAGASAGGGNIVVNVPGGSFTSRSTISQTVLGNAGGSLTTSGATGGAANGSAISVASRGTTTINQLGSAQSNFIQGGNLQRDVNGVTVYRLASNPNIRVLIRGVNADGSLNLVDATTGQAIAGSNNIIIRNATTNRITNNAGGGTSGLIVRLGNSQPGNNQTGNVTGIVGETSLPASATGSNQLVVTTQQGTVDTGAVIPGVREIGAIEPVTIRPEPDQPGNGGGGPLNASLLRRAQDVERTTDEEVGPDVIFAQSDSLALAADALAAGQEEGILTQRVERQVAIPMTTDIPEKKEEDPLGRVTNKPKPKMQVLPQLW
jgi:filamentous hemagglutinin family protein